MSTLPDEAPVLPRLLASLAALHFSRYELGQDRGYGARQAVMLYASELLGSTPTRQNR